MQYPPLASKRPQAQRVSAEDSRGRLAGEHPRRPAHRAGEDFDRAPRRKDEAREVPEREGGRPRAHEAPCPAALQLLQGNPLPPAEGHRAPDRGEPSRGAELPLEVEVRLRYTPD